MDYVKELSKIGKQIFDRVKEVAANFEGVAAPKDLPIFFVSASGEKVDYNPRGGMVSYGTSYGLSDTGVGFHCGADGTGRVHDGWDSISFSRNARLNNIKTEADYQKAKGYLESIKKDCETLVFDRESTERNAELGKHMHLFDQVRQGLENAHISVDVPFAERVQMRHPIDDIVIAESLSIGTKRVSPGLEQAKSALAKLDSIRQSTKKPPFGGGAGGQVGGGQPDGR